MEEKKENVIISTTGTSLLSNGINHVNKLANLGNQIRREYIFLHEKIIEASKEYPRGRVNINTMNYLESLPSDQKTEVAKNLIKEAIKKYIEEEGGERASAEINTLESMFKKYNQLNSSNSKIVFLYSDTFIGQICAEILEEYFNSFEVRLEKIIGLTYKAPQFIFKGLNNLIEKTIEIIKSHEDCSIKLAITGGFKAEFAYITLIGSLYNIELYYKHEILKDLIRLPPLSIKINEKYYLKYLKLFNLLNKDNNYEQIKEIFPNAEENMELKFLMEKSENSFIFTPSGKIVNEILGKRAIRVFISHTEEKIPTSEYISKELEKIENYIYIPLSYKKRFALLSESKSQLKLPEIIHQNIEDCECFISLIGSKIGSFLNEEKNISWIEDEFDYACNSDKKILIFVPKKIFSQLKPYKILKTKINKDILNDPKCWDADREIFDLLLKMGEQGKYIIDIEKKEDIIKQIKLKWHSSDNHIS